jgi:hypothetical protein
MGEDADDLRILSVLRLFSFLSIVVDAETRYDKFEQKSMYPQMGIRKGGSRSVLAHTCNPSYLGN